MTVKPRGIRLNNPGAIRHNPNNPWQGKSVDQPDPSFVKFDDPIFGVRAIARILIGYEKRGLNTVRKVIETWAPPNENNTTAYVNHVADELNVDPDDVIDVDSEAVMMALIPAIIEHENGVPLDKKAWYSDKVIREGIKRAGIVGAKGASLTASNAVKAQITAATMTGAAVVAPLAEPAMKAATALEPMAESPWIGHMRTIFLTVAGIAVVVGLWLAAQKHKKGL